MFQFIDPKVGLLQTDFLTFKSAKVLISKLNVKAMLTWLLLLEIFRCNGSSPSLNFSATTLLRISYKHFQVKNILVELTPLTKNHPKWSIYIMDINHLNALAQDHANYMFKVVILRELTQE